MENKQEVLNFYKIDKTLKINQRGCIFKTSENRRVKNPWFFNDFMLQISRRRSILEARRRRFDKSEQTASTKRRVTEGAKGDAEF